MALLKSDYSLSEEIFDFADSRVMRWSLIPSPAPLIYISLVYLFIVNFVGPRFMKDRRPYTLKTFMQYYNIFQVIANSWIVFNIVIAAVLPTAIWKYCDSFDNICGHNAEWLLEVAWWALLLKVIDLSETIVFLLRKKNNQISFLHVYHHISTIFVLWGIIRYLLHGYLLYLMAFNCGVHVIMYSYYFLSSYGPDTQRLIRPFKKWITILQMMQITLLMLPTVQGFTSYCNTKERYLSILLLFNGFANLLLFWNFYKNSYKKRNN